MGGARCVPNASVACTCADGRTGQQVCNPQGTAFTGTCTCGCAPTCGTNMCGSDGCGGSCGTCSAGTSCVGGACAGAPCGGGCALGYACNGTACVLDGTHTWIVRISHGTVEQRDCAGASWDAFGGLPDPMVCATVRGAQYCTDVQADTIAPRWVTRDLPPVSAATLLAGIRMDYYDVDTSVNDTICGGQIVFTEAELAAGTATRGCSCGGVRTTSAWTMYLLP